MSAILREYKKVNRTISVVTKLIENCFSAAEPTVSLKSIHALLLKLNFNSNTYIGNRCTELYFKLGLEGDALRAFNEIASKNTVSWNLYLRIHVECLDIETARYMFDEIPNRDVVSWNTMLSGFVSRGLIQDSRDMFVEMIDCGVRPNMYTFSTMLGCMESVAHIKELHGFIVRNCCGYLNLIVGNCLIDAYGKFGVVDYAFVVFLSMERVDVISWNSLISGCCKSGCEELALSRFFQMSGEGYKADEFTVSILLNACSKLQDLANGSKIFCLGVKLGFMQNTVVSSAAIDLFSKCNQLGSAIHVFEESPTFDVTICNSMIACYASHNLDEFALGLFVSSFRENVRPTEYTLSCLLYCSASFVLTEQGNQLHSLVVKMGFESDEIVTNSLVQMYSKYGLVGFALNAFSEMGFRDLTAWNTMIQGLAENGKIVESICLFKELLKTDLLPDRTTFSGVLLSCSYGGHVDEAMSIFSLMTKYGVSPTSEHYDYIVETMVRASKINGLVEFIRKTRYEPNLVIWETILRLCVDCENLELIESVAEEMMDREPQSFVPYSILSYAYELAGKWERLVRIRNKMNRMKIKEEVGFSSIGIRNCIYSFDPRQLIHYAPF